MLAHSCRSFVPFSLATRQRMKGGMRFEARPHTGDDGRSVMKECGLTGRTVVTRSTAGGVVLRCDGFDSRSFVLFRNARARMNV